jgi:hypothetical protein
MAQVIARLLTAVVPHFRAHAVTEQVPLFALLAVAAGPRQVPALSRAAIGGKDHEWLTGWRAPYTRTDSDEGEDEEEAEEEEEQDEEEAAIAFRRRRFNTGVARVATRLLELAPRAVPEIELCPCPGRRTVDIVRVAVATQPDTMRRLALRLFGGSETDEADAVKIWKLACATWGPSSLRDLTFITNLFQNLLRYSELALAAARCPHLEVLSIPRIVLPPSFVASMTEGSAASSGVTNDPDSATPADGLAGLDLPLPTIRCFDVPLRPPPDFAPYSTTLRSLELSNGPGCAAEFAFVATQLPSLRCLRLATDRLSIVPIGVWRRGLRQLLLQLHTLYISRVTRPLCRALNTLQTLAAADAQRSAALRLPPGAMATILQPDSDETDSSEDDITPNSWKHAESTTAAADAIPTQDIPLQAFSIYESNNRGRDAIAPFVRYLARHAPFLTEIWLGRTLVDTAAELITMRGPCRALSLRDICGLTDTIVASILKRHRATLRQTHIQTIYERRDVAEFDPRAYKDVLGEENTPQGAPFIKIAYAGFQQSGWSDEQRTYFSYLFPGLCDPPFVGFM